MRPVCTVCTHAQRVAIDADLVAGPADRPTAAKYGLSRASLRRHQDNHLGAVVEAVEARAATLVARSEAQHAEGVVGLLLAGYRRATDLESQALRLAGLAEENGKIGTAILGVGEARQALGEQRQHLTVVGKATGEIGADVEINVFGISTRAAKVGAMLEQVMAILTEHWPEAAADVGRRLTSGGAGGVVVEMVASGGPET